MKKTNIFTFAALAVLFTISFSSCASKPVDEEKPAAPAEAENPDQDQPVEVLPDEEGVILIQEEDDATDDEYFRSIANLDQTETVSKQEFADDKNEILEIISQLSVIMETQDTLAWLSYIEDESKEYYKNPVNLRKAQRKLPNKLIELKNIEDYFKYVFIPARKNRQIDEIRYISKTQVNAVQVREETDVIFYSFKKSNGKWQVYIPPVS